MGNKMKEETINNVIKMALHKAKEPGSTFCETNIDDIDFEKMKPAMEVY